MAVYTDVSDAELRRFVADYDLGEVLSCKGIAEGVENSNYLISTDRQQNFILTLYEKRVEARDLPFFIGLMEHLAAAGFSCPTPIRGRDGVALRSLCGRPAAIISFLAGLWPRTIETRHCAPVGTALASLHAAAEGFALTRTNALSLEGWRGLVDRIAPHADDFQPGLARDLARELALLDEAWPHQLPTGIIHADMFPDNVFFRDGSVSGVIDFYFACTDALAYDLMITLNAWCFDDAHRFCPERAHALVAAYERIRPLEAAERRALPILARGAALRFLLTRLYDWFNRSPGALVKPKDPREYLAKLRFHRTVGGPEAYCP